MKHQPPLEFLGSVTGASWGSALASPSPRNFCWPRGCTELFALRIIILHIFLSPSLHLGVLFCIAGSTELLISFFVIFQSQCYYEVQYIISFKKDSNDVTTFKFRSFVASNKRSITPVLVDTTYQASDQSAVKVISLLSVRF